MVEGDEWRVREALAQGGRRTAAELDESTEWRRGEPLTKRVQLLAEVCRRHREAWAKSSLAGLPFEIVDVSSPEVGYREGSTPDSVEARFEPRPGLGSRGRRVAKAQTVVC